MPFALTVLIGAQLAGEVLRRLLHLPLPGPVIGMFLLAVLLAGPAKRWLTDASAEPAAASPLEKTSTALITNMGLLFVPAGVGIIAELDVLRRAWPSIVAALVVSTVLGLVVTGVVMHTVMRRTERATASGTGTAPESGTAGQ